MTSVIKNTFSILLCLLSLDCLLIFVTDANLTEFQALFVILTMCTSCALFLLINHNK